MTLEFDLQEKFHNQSQMLANKVKKRFKHLRKRYAGQNIEVFRLYDWDIPEIRAAVDWYAGHLVIAEYTRKQSTPRMAADDGSSGGGSAECSFRKGASERKIHGGTGRRQV